MLGITVLRKRREIDLYLREVEDRDDLNKHSPILRPFLTILAVVELLRQTWV
jgi:hypothetical protein